MQFSLNLLYQSIVILSFAFVPSLLYHVRKLGDSRLCDKVGVFAYVKDFSATLLRATALRAGEMTRSGKASFVTAFGCDTFSQGEGYNAV
jgi:hypothetical protein